MVNEQPDAPPREPDSKEPARNHGSHLLERSAQQAMRRERAARKVPEPSLGSRLGQIGMLGWMVVIPTLLCLWIGHWLDRRLATGVFFSAPLLMIGAAIGLWLAWRWMHRQNPED
ncbi:AtpZ/AtpI family protein [Trinickia sp. Y13]|uniref:AtpZ/AtpI family protein n=1 Tax=Trinickia sp. Y13 TaxID=2917807 RepID=UPI002407492E|nr:AtpZ/AtpI family protein [Trinickia sp. Y13]